LRDELIAEELFVLDASDARSEVGILLEALTVRERADVAEALRRARVQGSERAVTKGG